MAIIEREETRDLHQYGYEGECGILWKNEGFDRSDEEKTTSKLLLKLPLIFIQEVSYPSSPHTWGCFQWQKLPHVAHLVFPAHVGVFLKQDEILKLISINPLIRAKEVAEQLDLTVDGVWYHLVKMRKSGVVRYERVNGSLPRSTLHDQGVFDG